MEYTRFAIRVRENLVEPGDAVIDLLDGSQIDITTSREGKITVRHLSPEEVQSAAADVALLSQSPEEGA